MLQPRLRRLLLWVALPVVFLVLLYAGLGFWAVPRLVRSELQSFVTQNYHRQVTVGEVRFNPFTLRMEVRDFVLPDTDGQPLVAFRYLLVDLTVASIWHLGPDFEAIRLEQPFARVLIRPDGSLNLSDLALPSSPNAKPEAHPKPARLFINHFSMEGGNVAFEDRAHPSAFRAEIKPITFDLRHFSTVSKDGGTYALSGASDAGERFTWAGSLSANPLASHGQFEVTDLQAHTLWNYLRDSVQFELPSGVISLNGDYAFTAATSPIGLGVNVHDVTVTDLGLRPKGGAEDYVKLARVEVHDTQADITKRTVNVGSVHFAGGEIHAWVNEHGAINLLELTAPSNPAPGAETAQTHPAEAATPIAPAPTSVAPPPDVATWTICVPDVAIDTFKVSAEDRQVTPAFALQLDNLNIHAKGFTTARSTPLEVTLSSRLNGEAQLDATANLSPDLAAMKAQAELTKLDLTMLQPYIAQRTSMTLRNGFFSTKLNVDRGADGQLAVTGDAQITKLRTVDNALNKDFIKVERLQVAGLDYHSKPASLKIHSIIANGPYARVIIEADRTVNVSKVLRAPGAPPPAANTSEVSEAAEGSPTSGTATISVTPGTATSGTAASGTAAPESPTSAATPSGAATASAASAPSVTAGPSDATGSKGHGKRARSKSSSSGTSANGSTMPISIGSVRIQDGSANYADFWIQPNFAVGIQTLNGSIVGLSSNPRSRAKVELQGKVDRYAPVHIWGSVNPLAATAYSDIKMTFKGVELVSATPYSGRFAGYKIEKGKLSVDIGYKIDNRQLTAEHRFVIDQLELGERVESPDAIHLPLKIAIALLKDRNGVIDINLPVTGSLDDPKFSLGPLIWKAVLGLLAKIATAPFALLGHLFGGGEQMNFIDFRAGSAVLEPSESEKLASLVKALKEKSQLELDVPVAFSADLDRQGLAAARLQRRLVRLKNEQAGDRKHGKGTKSASAAPAPPSAASPASASSSVASAPTMASAQTDQAATDAASTEPAPTDPALTDPTQHFHLLAALYRADQGKDTVLPSAAQAAEAAEKQKTPPDFGTANAELETALLQKMSVTDADLQALGSRRAHAIQDALLAGGEIDAARVFIIGSEAKPASADKDKVRVELALK
jgi:hypothetical protein